MIDDWWYPFRCWVELHSEYGKGRNTTTQTADEARLTSKPTKTSNDQNSFWKWIYLDAPQSLIKKNVVRCYALVFQFLCTSILSHAFLNNALWWTNISVYMRYDASPCIPIPMRFSCVSHAFLSSTLRCVTGA